MQARLRVTVVTAVVASTMTLLAVAMGAWMFGSHPAGAQAPAGRAYRECFFAHQEGVDINDQGLVQVPTNNNRRILIPSGWEVAAGGGIAGEWQGNVLLCR
ncbi:MAG: hypothetical protein AB7S26_23430 [Sandaracinaceae bacterium]